MKITDLAYYVHYINRLIHYFWGAINLIYAWWWHIKIGEKSKFTGHCYFKRYKGSAIQIGRRFECISKIKANLIYRPCCIMTCSKDANLEIGNNVGVSGCVIACFKYIKIGNNVKIGGNCTIMDGDFHSDDYRSGIPSDVIIEDNVWLGMNVMIMKGVHIGENSVIGAGSIVTKDIPANVVAAGNPCRIIKNIEQ
jgi:acetyltransferase-like isoleucine patch superfamily enzyme